MPRERTFWMVLASLVLVGLLGGLFGRRVGTYPLTLAQDSPRPRSQEVRERVWRAARFEPVANVPAGAGAAVEMPTLLRVNGRGDVYVLDSGRSEVRRLSPGGRLQTVYRDPSLGNPTDVAVAAGGEVWVCDPDHRQVAVFSAVGRLVRRIALDPAVARLVVDPTGGFVATGLTGGKGLFRRYSADGEPEGSFGTLFQEELQTWVVTDGWFVSGEPGALIYPFRNAGLLISYTMDGRLRFFRQTIAPLPLPKVRMDAAGRQSLMPDTPLSSISGSIVGDDLYVLSAAGTGGRRVLDVYDARTGSYRYSLQSPEGDARYVVLAKDFLYSASRQGVTVWRRVAH